MNWGDYSRQQYTNTMAEVEEDPSYHRYMVDENPDHPLLSESSSSSNSSFTLVQVSNPLLFLTAAPLLVVIAISAHMEMSLEWPVVIGTVRTFVQLSILAMILNPIFELGETYWWLVLGYTCLMVLLAAGESMNRSRYQFPGMFIAILSSMGFNVLWVAIFAFGVVLRPDPLWDPQYVIPIVGMLLGNCINGVGLALNHMLSALVEQSREVELYLSFGATPREATIRLMRESVRVGAMPQLNAMAIIGLINIPGMMTGQILGGSSVQQAARYQMLIMYLIAMCSFFTILSEVCMALKAGFDPSARLRTDYFTDTNGIKKASSKANNGKSQGWWHRYCCCCWCNRCFCPQNDEAQDEDAADLIPAAVNNLHDTETTGLLSNGQRSNTASSNGAPLETDMEFRKVMQSGLDTGPPGSRLEITTMTHSFIVLEGQNADNETDPTTTTTSGAKFHQQRRILFENVSMELKSGEITLVSGPSGIGKSTFLRLVAGLEPIVGTANHPAGYIQLHIPPEEGRHPTSYDSQRDWALWRRQVRYVTQLKVDIMGTPKQFIRRICSLQVCKNNQLPPSNNPSFTNMSLEVRELVRAWGMDSSCWDSEWTTLSGGEAQRMIVAIALASRPRVLLLDESTSALDLRSKLMVEESIVHYCRSFGMCALWITHDPEQMERLATR